MRIAYLTNQYPSYSHSFIRREIDGLDDCGVTVDRYSIRATCCLVDDDDKRERERTRAILNVGIAGLLLNLIETAVSRPIHFTRALWLALRMGMRCRPGVVRHLAYLAEACVLLKWIRETGAQHIHAHFATNSTAVAMLCNALGGPPFSFTAHGSCDIGIAPVIALGEKIRRAAFVVTASEFGRSQLFRWCGRESWNKIAVVHCGVDEAFLNAPHVPIPDEPRFVCVGRLSSEKGQLLLVEAAALLAAEGTLAEIVLIGDGPMRPEIEALIARSALDDCVHITGWADADRVRREILAARALVLPSFYEGLPVVIMEAFALMRPVIATHIGGVPELVEPGVTGWLVPADSPAALAAAMRHVIEAPDEELRRMARNGAERVARHHNARTEAAKLVTLFAGSIARNAGEDRAYRLGGVPAEATRGR